MFKIYFTFAFLIVGITGLKFTLEPGQSRWFLLTDDTATITNIDTHRFQVELFCDSRRLFVDRNHHFDYINCCEKNELKITNFEHYPLDIDITFEKNRWIAVLCHYLIKLNHFAYLLP